MQQRHLDMDVWLVAEEETPYILLIFCHCCCCLDFLLGKEKLIVLLSLAWLCARFMYTRTCSRFVLVACVHYTRIDYSHIKGVIYAFQLPSPILYTCISNTIIYVWIMNKTILQLRAYSAGLLIMNWLRPSIPMKQLFNHTIIIESWKYQPVNKID